MGVIDNHDHMIPVAWSITEQSSSSGLQLFLEAVMEKGCILDPSFSFGCALTSDDATEQLAIRFYFYASCKLGCSYLLSAIPHKGGSPAVENKQLCSVGPDFQAIKQSQAASDNFLFFLLSCESEQNCNFPKQ